MTNNFHDIWGFEVLVEKKLSEFLFLLCRKFNFDGKRVIDKIKKNLFSFNIDHL
jgi:hypothetical protein